MVALGAEYGLFVVTTDTHFDKVPQNGTVVLHGVSHKCGGNAVGTHADPADSDRRHVRCVVSPAISAARS